METLEVSQIPDFHLPVAPPRRHVIAPQVVSDCSDWPPVAQHLHQTLAAGGTPQRDDAAPVAAVDYAVVGVLGHDVAGTQFRAVLRDEGAGGCVGVL